MCSIFSMPISCFFGCMAEVKAAKPCCSAGLRDWRWATLCFPILPMTFPNPLGRKQHPYRWEQRNLRRNDEHAFPKKGWTLAVPSNLGFSDLFSFFSYVWFFGEGLVCSSFGKRRTTVPSASASCSQSACSEQHRRREGAGTTLGPYLTGRDGLGGALPV